jgi:large subunit ribosomal protein L15
VKLHDLKPAPGSRKARTRVGRGIAAGKGKTAGRGTKGQKSRAGASIPAWFEGGQTPIHIRVPKLRGFKRRFKVEYQVVNVGRIAEYAAAGRFGVEPASGPSAARGKGTSDAPVTVNSEVLASAGLIGSLRRPVKVLGHGDVDQKLFVAADAFTASAREKIEAAGGFVQVLAPAPDAEASLVVANPDVAVIEAPATDGEPAQPADASVPTADATAVAEPADAPADELDAAVPAGATASDAGEPADAPAPRRARGTRKPDAEEDAATESGRRRAPRRRDDTEE